MLPRRRSSRLRNSTPLKPLAQTVAHLESVTEFHEASMLETQTKSQTISPTPKTPVTAGRIRPAPEEMHPSKAHHSTTQEPDSGLRLGFTDIKAESSNQPSGIAQKTPSKINVARPSFDFRCARPGLQLGPEAQRIMDELNEEALRIKASLAAEREEKKRIASCDENFKTHKQTRSKHKTGRFSDAHKAEFRKMDSIAGHPSAFRAQLSRTAPAKNSLKRSQSKAYLDTGNSDEMVHDRSGDNLHKSDRHQINQPMKIARKHITDDISSASRNQQISSTLDIPSSRSKIPSAIHFPTQASLSRARVKKPMPREPSSSKSQKTSFNNPLSPNSKSANTGDTSKSDCIRFPVLGLEATTESITLPNISNCKSKNDLRKGFSLSNSHTGIGNSNKTKNVNFTPKTINKHAAAAQNSPSPVKSSIPRSISKPNFNADSLNASDSKAPETSRNVEYSSLPNLLSPHRLCQDNSSSSIPSSFTFRSDQTIKFGASPNHHRSTSIKNSNAQLPKDNGSHLSTYSSSTNHKEKQAINPLPPSRVSNKRRKRPDADDEHNLTERSPKKLKYQDTKSTIPRLKVMQGSYQKIQSPQKKSGVLSLSRLNILSRPKIRR